MPATNAFAGRVPDPGFPEIWKAKTAADSDETYVFSHVKCTVAGNVSLRNFKDASTVVLPIAVGEIVTGQFDRVNTSGTTATGLFIGYCIG